jgi:hypothetical protein
MTLRALHELQEVMFRVYVRNVILMATLPFHVRGGVDGTPTRVNLAPAHRSCGANRVRDARWLR